MGPAKQGSGRWSEILYGQAPTFEREPEDQRVQARKLGLEPGACCIIPTGHSSLVHQTPAALPNLPKLPVQPGIKIEHTSHV
jgi:hypothetical protein